MENLGMEERKGMIRLEKMEEQLDFEIHELYQEKQFVEKLIKELNDNESKDHFFVNYDVFLQDSMETIELRISELEQELKELQEDIKDQVAFMKALSIVDLLNNDIGADLEQGELFDIAIKAVVDIEKALELENKLK